MIRTLRTPPVSRLCRILFLSTCALSLALLGGGASKAATIVNMNFNGATGLENTGLAPDGVLKNGASIVAGELVTNGTKLAEPGGAGLELDLTGYDAFSGAYDVYVSFDFATIGGDARGPLFSADGGKYVIDNFPESAFPAGQGGSLNINYRADRVEADLWFIDTARVNGTFNDNQFHHVDMSYHGLTGRLNLTVDGLPTNQKFIPGGFLRDTSHDIVRLGDQTNSDVYSTSLTSANNLTAARFDNLIIKMEVAQIPEPFSWLLLSVGAIGSFAMHRRR